MKNDPETPPPGGQFLVYRTQDGKLKIDVRFEGETVWLTQQHMADLFQTTKQNVSLPIQHVFSEGELAEVSVVKESLTTAADGKNYATKFYNLTGELDEKTVCRDFRHTAEDQAEQSLPMARKDWAVKLEGVATVKESLTVLDQATNKLLPKP